MSETVEAAKRVLADSYKFTLLAQNYHWNVEGMFFGQLHELFGNIYEEVQNNIDRTAEHIRAMDSLAPASFKRFNELSRIPDEIEVIEARQMIERLSVANDMMILSILDCFEKANSSNNQGLANFMAERHEAHKKHGWMLKATLR
jgi:starvation-inducible DNA-binding protein